MSTASHPRHDAPHETLAYANLASYESLSLWSSAVIFGQVLVVLVGDVLVVTAGLLLLGTLGTHVWHRHETSRQVRQPGSVSLDRALWAQLSHGVAVAIAGPCAVLFLATELLADLFG